MITVIFGATAVILTILFWGQWRRWQENNRRQQGMYTVAIGNDYTVAAGCLGISGYLGLLFVVVWLTFDLVEEASAPGWLSGVVAMGMIAGFIFFVLWAVVVVGKSFASTLLRLDPQGVRLTKWGQTKTEINWHEPWELQQYADVHQFRDVKSHEWLTEYALMLQLSQKKSRLVLRFETAGERVGGLPTYEGDVKGYPIDDMADWVEIEIIRRYTIWEETDGKRNDEHSSDETISASKTTSKQRSAAPPNPQLMEALNFTGEDLISNREGKYRAAQAAPIRRNSWMTLATYMVLFLIFGWLAINAIIRIANGAPSETDWAALMVYLLVCGFCSLMAFATYAGMQIDFNIVQIQGAITLRHYPQSGEYWLRLEDTAVPISKETYNALDDQACYALYFISPGIDGAEKTLISAEKCTG